MADEIVLNEEDEVQDSTWNKAKSFFSFRATIVFVMFCATVFFFWKGNKEATYFFSTLFSTWTGYWLFTKEEQ